MWIIFKLRSEFNKIKDSLKDLTSKVLSSNVLIENNKEKIKEFVSKKEVDLMIREAILEVQSVQTYAPNNELNTEETHAIELKRAMDVKSKKSKVEALKMAMRECIERDMRTTDIYNLIVLEKKLISKTQFYHYLSIIKAELRSGLRTKLQTK